MLLNTWFGNLLSIISTDNPPDFASMKSMGADGYVAWGVVIILNAVIMGLETDSESAIFEWTEQVGLVLWSVGPQIAACTKQMPTSKCTRQNLDSYININLLKKKSWNLQPTNLTTSLHNIKITKTFFEVLRFSLHYFPVDAAVHVGLLRDGSSPSDQASKLWRRCYLLPYPEKTPQLSSKMWIETIWSLPFFKGIPATTQNHFSKVLEETLHVSGRVFGPTEV